MSITRTTGQQEGAISVDNHSFTVDGKAKMLYAGAMHYWRIERPKWSPILDEVKRMGFTAISIYIPWEVHEVERGRFDFDGNKDIGAFLSLIEAKGLDVIVRPGPQINAELTWFGYPLRILRDPELQALNARGTPAVLTQVPRPIPAISYAADKFFDEAALWYDAICPLLQQHVHPHGRLFAAQVDNEMAYFFHVNAYAADYHPASVANYRTFLADKYGDITELVHAYGRRYESFEAVEPPRRFEATGKEDIPYYTDWAAYREHYLVSSIGRLAQMLRVRGLDKVALFHNYPHPLGPGGAASGFTAPFNLAALEEKVDFVGFDVYARKELYSHVKTILSYVVGTSRFPYVPEFIAGVWPWYLHPGNLADEEFVTKAGLMQGIKGFSRYMLVERDRWLDSPVRRDGRVRSDHAAMFALANNMAMKSALVDLRRQADVLLLANRDYDRLEAASVLVSFPGDFLETPSGFSEYPTFMTVSEATLGLEEAVQVAKSTWFEAVTRGLNETGFTYLLSDTGLAPERWRQSKVVMVASFEYMATELQRNLVEFAESGGTVVLGPRLPSLNERVQPDETLRRALTGAEPEPIGDLGRLFPVGKGRVVLIADLSDPAKALEAALGGLRLVRFHCNDQRVDVTVHVPADGSARRVVYVANPTGETIDAQVSLSPSVTFVRELWQDEELTPAKTLRKELAPYSVSIYEARLEP